MGQRLARRVLSGRADANILFGDLRRLLLTLGFTERVRGSHHVLVKEGVEELVNLQCAGAQAKPYQVRQVSAVLRRSTAPRKRSTCGYGRQKSSSEKSLSRGAAGLRQSEKIASQALRRPSGYRFSWAFPLNYSPPRSLKYFRG